MCHVGAYCGRYTIVVDDDIDVSNLEEVIWALIDSDSEQQPCAADLVRPRRNYARHTGGLNVFSQ